MNSIENFVTRYITTNLTKVQRRQITVDTLRYIYRIINSAELNRRLNATVGHNVRTLEIRRNILADGYVMRNIKAWLFYVSQNNLIRKDRKHWADCFKINAEDIELLTLLGSDLKKDFDKLSKSGCVALSLKHYNNAIQGQLEGVMTFTKKLVFRKMRFIVQTQGIEYTDLTQTLYADAFQTILFYYPMVQSDSHCQNIMKRKIANSGKNLIDFYACDKRSKFVKSCDGLTNKIVPMSFAVTDENCAPFLSTTLTNSTIDYDLSLDVRKILSSYSGKRQRFLQILMNYDEAFSTWLEKSNITHHPNDEYMDKVSTEVYMKHILVFLGVSEQSGEKFVSTLKQRLA